jgi:hypothetical protein
MLITTYFPQLHRIRPLARASSSVRRHSPTHQIAHWRFTVNLNLIKVGVTATISQSTKHKNSTKNKSDSSSLLELFFCFFFYFFSFFIFFSCTRRRPRTRPEIQRWGCCFITASALTNINRLQHTLQESTPASSARPCLELLHKTRMMASRPITCKKSMLACPCLPLMLPTRLHHLPVQKRCF